MYQKAHDAYLESRILSAEPVELIGMMYQACTGAVGDARHYLALGDIAMRSQSISKACEILMEMAGALDHERGGEISRRLASLYEYMQRRLMEANLRQSEDPMIEVLGLLVTLTEAWNGLKAQMEPAVPAPASWMPPQETAAPGASHAWSF